MEINKNCVSLIYGTNEKHTPGSARVDGPRPLLGKEIRTVSRTGGNRRRIAGPHLALAGNRGTPLPVKRSGDFQQKTLKMRIPDELMEKRNKLKSVGDVDKMRVLCGTNMTSNAFRSALSRMYKTRSGPDWLFEAIRDYYTAKELRLFPKKENNEK